MGQAVLWRTGRKRRSLLRMLSVSGQGAVAGDTADRTFCPA